MLNEQSGQEQVSAGYHVPYETGALERALKLFTYDSMRGHYSVRLLERPKVASPKERGKKHRRPKDKRSRRDTRRRRR